DHPGGGERLRPEHLQRHHQQVKALAVRRRTIAIFRNRRFSYHGGPPLTAATISRPVKSIKRTGVTARGSSGVAPRRRSGALTDCAPDPRNLHRLRSLVATDR